MATAQPTSKSSRRWPAKTTESLRNRNSVPTARRMRSSVGPILKYDRRKIPSACGQRDLNRQQVVSNQEPGADGKTHVSPGHQSSHQEEDAQRIQHVVHVEAVTRPFLMTHTGQGAIETVTEPVGGEQDNDGDEGCWKLPAHPVADARGRQGNRSERRQVVRVDPPWQTLGDPNKDFLLTGREEAAVNARFPRFIGHAGCSCPVMRKWSSNRLTR